ncbi:DUF3152 domain-containing protein [Streptomyces chiangmaiensis]|uniref:DUF3152 domain-containing protein n=1 Tax=Streptomyces chiangmaiensis TaxID=766497 RepID=A0ABU7FM98_9ACTN|nr:DUF3152 domain-containing protein [Streptomyces chiangmaiensis]MED7825076.1 DUF3152 domain-containing protein [Streptomyces chiangmaiensis]
MGRHSRKGRGDRTHTDTGTAPGIPATDVSARGAADARHGIEGTPAQGIPRFRDGTPAHGVPRFPDGTPAQGVPRFPGGAPAQRVPWPGDGTPAHGVPRFADGTPAHGVPQVRGGHPQQRESGGGWGEFRAGTVSTEAPQAAPPGRPGSRIPAQRPQADGPRQEYLDAFDEDDDVFTPRCKGVAVPRTETSPARTDTETGDAPAVGAQEAPREGNGRGRTFAGIAAAAVTTVLAVVVAGQVTDGQGVTAAKAPAGTDRARDIHGSATRGDGRPTPSTSPAAAPLTYEQAMDRRYPLSATLKGSGKYYAVPGFAKAPGTGRKYTYRVDVEKGLGLDGELFAQAVQKTLNDDRSWAHHGARTFERIYSGKPDFVITLASPGTTADWCAKSGLDTTEDNVSCDSASTERVMINAYRWAQGATTYGDEIHSYRQMLINHEVGHRLGYGHVTCDKDGEPAPVMQQQTKFLDHDGIHCLPNPWPYPRS